MSYHEAQAVIWRNVRSCAIKLQDNRQDCEVDLLGLSDTEFIYQLLIDEY